MVVRCFGHNYKTFLSQEMTSYDLRAGQPIKLVGVAGDSHMCHTHFKRYDSCIFLASVRRSPRIANKLATSVASLTLHLNSSLIRMTLMNLDRVDTAVNRFGQYVISHWLIFLCSDIVILFGLYF
jgi:hypothetical protein